MKIRKNSEKKNTEKKNTDKTTEKNIEESQKIDISSQISAEDENDKNFRLEQILAETRYISEQDAMRKAAEKYGARPHMDEIFSNTRRTPLQCRLR